MVGAEYNDDEDETAHTRLHTFPPPPPPSYIILLLFDYCYLVIYIIIYSVNLIYIYFIVIVIKQTRGYGYTLGTKMVCGLVTHTRHHRYGFSRVWVQVRPKVPMGYL
jgi:hypothetical protein